MISTIVFAAALSLPANARAVRIAADTWPSIVDLEKAEPLQKGERLWWWSPDCAPSRMTAESPEAKCQPATPLAVRVLDERSKFVAGTRVIWGTAEMLSDLPETMLPSATAADDGSVTIALPSGAPVYVRAAGPKAASWWQYVAATRAPLSIRTSPAIALAVTIRIPGGGATRSIVEIAPIALTASPSDVRSWAAAERDTVSFLPMPAMPVSYTAWCDDAVAQEGTAMTAAFPRSLALARGMRAEALVVDAKRIAVRGAAVEAVFKLHGASRGLRRRASSDANGRFVLRGLPAGMVQLLVRKSGYATVVRMQKLEPAAAIADFVLRPSRSVVVQVVDGAGRPVAGAEIRTTEGVRATAGKDGLAPLDGVPAGEDFSIDVRAAGFREAELPVAANAKSPIKAALSRGVGVTATLRNERREPAGPGTVMVVNNGGRHLERLDASGRIDIGGLAAGTLSLEIRADGAAPYAVTERTVRDDEQLDLGELLLPRGASMRGRIVSRSGGSPIANARVRALRRGGFGPIGAFVMRDWAEAFSGGDDGAFVIAGVESGPQVLLIESAGFASRVVSAELRAGAEAVLDLGAIELDRGRELIVDCTPTRRCGNEARLLFAGVDLPWAFVGGAMQEGSAHLLPASSGQAMLRILDNGRLVEERPVEVSAQSDVTRVSVKLVSAAVTGTVTAAGRPRDSGQVHLERVSADSHVMPVYVESRTAEGQVAGSRWISDTPAVQMADVDPAGRFRFADVQPGTYKASYRRNGSSTAAMTVTVPESERFDFTIDLPPGELRGRVTDEAAVPIRLAGVEVRDASGELRATQTDASGEFAMSGLVPGHARLRASTRNAEGTAEVEIDPTRIAAANVVLKARERKRTAIAVTDPSGQPLSGALVFLLGSGGPLAGVATTDSSGTANFTLSQPLTTPAAAYHSAYGWSWLAPQTIGSADGPECTIRMNARTGCVVVSSAKPASVDLYAPSGIPLGSAFAFLGIPISVTPGGEMRVPGLPPGAYTLRAGQYQASADVRADRDARVTFH